MFVHLWLADALRAIVPSRVSPTSQIPLPLQLAVPPNTVCEHGNPLIKSADASERSINATKTDNRRKMITFRTMTLLVRIKWRYGLVFIQEHPLFQLRNYQS